MHGCVVDANDNCMRRAHNNDLPDTPHPLARTQRAKAPKPGRTLLAKVLQTKRVLRPRSTKQLTMPHEFELNTSKRLRADCPADKAGMHVAQRLAGGRAGQGAGHACGGWGLGGGSAAAGLHAPSSSCRFSGPACILSRGPRNPLSQPSEASPFKALAVRTKEFQTKTPVR